MDFSPDLTPVQFEELVADYLREQGYQDVERVGRAGDRGVDIRCRNEHGRVVVVQCKRRQPSDSVTGPEIRTFFGEVVDHNAAKGIYVTTSRFTRAAVDQAARTDIELIDGTRIGAYHRRALQSREREQSPLRAVDPERPSEVEVYRTPVTVGADGAEAEFLLSPENVLLAYADGKQKLLLLRSSASCMCERKGRWRQKSWALVGFDADIRCQSKEACEEIASRVGEMVGDIEAEVYRTGVRVGTDVYETDFVLTTKRLFLAHEDERELYLMLTSISSCACERQGKWLRRSWAIVGLGLDVRCWSKKQCEEIAARVSEAMAKARS